jgi:hypothetical protein
MTIHSQNIVYLVKNWSSDIFTPTQENDYFQYIGINTSTLEIVDREICITNNDVPNTDNLKTWNEVYELYKLKGWKKL